MSTQKRKRGSSQQGSTVVEAIIGLLILATTVSALIGSSGFSSLALVTARRDLQWWAALQWKADSLMTVDSASAVDGTDVVNGYPVEWTVTGGTPPRIEVVVGGAVSVLNQAAVADTVVVYVRS